MNTTIYLCDDNLDSIFTAVYDAWASRKGHNHVRLQMNRAVTMELFCDYVTVIPDSTKAESVSRSIRGKISPKAWHMVYRAAMSPEDSRADDIYRFLVGGFYYGARVVDMLTEPAVRRIQELNRNIANETHYHKEFLRFDATIEGILFARIRPKGNILTMLAPHFADRLSGEDFIILDVGRQLAAVHPAGKEWYLAGLSREQAEALLTRKPDEYRELWKTFYDTIAITERKNPLLQRNHMPLWYREFMTEFL